MCRYLPRIKSCSLALRVTPTLRIFGETKSQQYSEHVYFSILSVDPKGIKRVLHFITNQLFRQCHVHIQVSLHQLIK